MLFVFFSFLYSLFSDNGRCLSSHIDKTLSELVMFDETYQLGRRSLGLLPRILIEGLGAPGVHSL